MNSSQKTPPPLEPAPTQCSLLDRVLCYACKGSGVYVPLSFKATYGPVSIKSFARPCNFCDGSGLKRDGSPSKRLLDV